MQHPVADNWHRYELKGAAQGTTYHIIYYAAAAIISQQAIDSVFSRLDQDFSLYRTGSLINQFNEAPRGILLSIHFRKVLEASILLNQETKGYNDITVYPLIKYWRSARSTKAASFDTPSFSRMKKCIGLQKLQFREDSLVKLESCVQIDLDGIAQGYSVDVIAGLLEQHEVKNYLVEIGGEVRVRGRHQPSGEKMKIALESIGDDLMSLEELPALCYLDSGALTTSGSYRKYLESGKQNSNHIIDPHTARPVSNDLLSVTVYAANAMTADGWDHALLAMGFEQAYQMVEQHPELAARFLYRTADGRLADTVSPSFQKLFHR